MKKKIITLLLLTIFIPHPGNARTIKYIELGINQSKFRTETCRSKIGPSLGVGLDYYPVKSFRGFVSSGLIYQHKKLFIENRTWPSALDFENASFVITGDLDINISYLEIPLLIGYSIDIEDQLTSSVLLGYGLSIPLMDLTRHTEKSTRKLEPNERGKYDFDYVLVDESSVSGAINYQLGLRLSSDRFAILFSYIKALSSTQNIEGINIQDKIDSYKISLAYIF